MELAELRPGPGFSAIKFIGYYSLRLVPWISLRNCVARVIAFCVGVRNRDPSNVSSKPRTPAADRMLNELFENGIAFCEPFPESHIADIREYLHDKPMVSEDGRRFTEDNVPDDVRLATYPLKTIVDCPHLLELMNHAETLQIAHGYLRCRPTISSVRIDWSFPGGDKPQYVQRFHRDHDDWAFLKYFLYLTDVDDFSGPHEFVRGSHRSSERRIGSEFYPEKEVDETFGLSNVIRIRGPKGTGFYEDTWGVHRGAMPSLGRRLMFQVQYSVLPIFKYNYKPIPLQSRMPIDTYVNRLLVSAAQTPALPTAAVAPT